MVVVGAGVIGCACAYYLRRAGADVVLLDQEAVASGASTHATGSLSLLSTDFNSPEYLRFGMASYSLTRDLVPELRSLTGIDVLYQQRPALRLALDAQEEAIIRESMIWQADLLPVKWVSADDVLAWEPRINREVHGAAYEEESAQLDSAKFTLALAMAAERMGARIVLRQAIGLIRNRGQVRGVRHSSGEIACDRVVLAMGPWAAKASPWVHQPIPIRVMKGERLQLVVPGPPLGFLLSTPRRGHMISRLDGYMSVGSTAGRDLDHKEQYVIEDSDDLTVAPSDAALLELTERALDILPEAVREAQVALHLAGVRPLSPDRRAIIGELDALPGVYLATGHGTKGIHLAAVTGHLIAELLLGGRTQLELDMSVVSPARFAAMRSQLVDVSDADVVDD